MKEVVYCVFGCVVVVVYYNFDFDCFLIIMFVKDVQVQDMMVKLFCWWIVILLSQWIIIKIFEVNRKVVFEIYCYLLNLVDDYNDEVVCIMVVCQFKYIVDDFEFKFEFFL